MFNITSGAFRWLSDNLRPRWLWASLAIGVGIFSVWDSIPEKFKTKIIDYGFEQFSDPTTSVDVEVASFQIEAPGDEEMLWVRNKIERNVVEFFVTQGLKTAHDKLTVIKSNGKAEKKIIGAVSSGAQEDFDITLRLVKGDQVLSTVSLEASLDYLKAHYAFVPEALIYGLDISMKTLKPLSSKTRPTSSLRSYALYLHARLLTGREKYVRARELLEEAIQFDEQFAMAHWAVAQILRVEGDEEGAAKREEVASVINIDHPRLPILTKLANPLPDLRAAITTVKWEELGKGFAYKDVQLKAYNIGFHAWRVDPSEFKISVALQLKASGSPVADLRRKAGAALALNGGFFEIDSESRLSSSGYLVSNGRNVAPYHKRGGSGVLYQNSERFLIGWSRDSGGLENVTEGVQSGPLVVDPGGINGIKNNDYNRVNRSAVCQRADSMIFVLVLGGLSLFELGDILSAKTSDGGFECERALNFDGGPSSQASFAYGGKALEFPGTWRVQNAVLVMKK